MYDLRLITQSVVLNVLDLGNKNEFNYKK